MLDKTTQIHIIVVPADLDETTLAAFFARLEASLSEAPAEIALDCSSLDHVTSSHINALWESRSRAEEAGIPVRLISVKYGLERILKLLDLYSLFVDTDMSDAEGEQEQVRKCSECSLMVELELKATVEGIRSGLDRFHDFLIRLNLPEISSFDLETVYYEIMTNIRLHGGISQNDSVMFTATVTGDMVYLHFVDRGPPFNAASKTPAFDSENAIQQSQRRGFSLVMINRLVDAMSYKRVNDKLNEVTLEKTLDHSAT